MNISAHTRRHTKTCRTRCILAAHRIRFRPCARLCKSHRLWRLAFGSAAVLLLSLLLAACSSSIEAVDVRTAEFDVPPNVEVTIDSGAGGIRLRGESGRETVTITATLHSFASTAELAAEQVEELEIDWRLEDRGVFVGFAPPQAPAIGRGAYADLELLVPSDSSLTLATDDGPMEITFVHGAIAASGRDDPIIVRETSSVLLLNGIDCDIVVEQASGDAIFATTTEGDLRFVNVRGLIDAETQEGDLRYAGRPSGRSNRLISHEGDLQVALPPDASLLIDASARRGLITADLPLVGDLTGNEWTATLNAPRPQSASTLRLVATEGIITIEPWDESTP